MTRAPRVAHLPPGGFLDTLARRWLDSVNAPEAGLILLPTRRAARSLADAFLHVAAGRPMLLPRITALGALDEVKLTLAGALDLPPAVSEAERRAVLAKLVMAALAVPAERAWALARELAALMDEAEREGIDLPAALRQPVPSEHARHWEVTRLFLAIATDAFPAWLTEQGLMNPAARQTALLKAQAAAWSSRAPDEPVWAAGFSGGPPAVAALLRVVAGLPNGQVVLPWLDPVTDPDETHPQSAPAALLAALDIRPEDVVAWGAPSERAQMLGAALLPAAALSAWNTRPASPERLFQLEPADAQEEAASIALALRAAIETPGVRAALVTPDRSLAVRVSAELLRWGIVADDSAGEKLALTPAAVLLRLLADAVDQDLAPLALLALLKHPLCALGLPPASCREAARALELVALRGARPPAGLSGLRKACEHAPAASEFVERLRVCLEPLLRMVPPRSYPVDDLLTALIQAGELVAATDAQAGEAILWRGEEGEALATLLADSLAALPHLPPQPRGALPGLFDALLEAEVVRGRRVLRGREGTEHPAVSIWGLLEARLQAVDVVVLGGLAEAVWPAHTDPGPWMSRQMRRDAGLPSGDAAIGQSAHDFVTAACMAPVAILSCPARRAGAPAVPSRWLARLDALLAGHAMGLPSHPAAAWARTLDLPGVVRPVEAPHPVPPVHLRPTKFSVSDIERLIADPYAIYARKILRLEALDPIEQETDALDIGTVVHAALDQFLRKAGADWPPDAARLLGQEMGLASLAARLRPALAAWWAPRMVRIAGWVADEETKRRVTGGPVALQSEVKGVWQLGRFTLTARADRLEQRGDGSLAILDYKTGVVPGEKAMRNGTSPQLPLEAAMAQAGAFGAAFTCALGELTYWKLSGGREPGEAKTVSGADLADIATEATQRVADLLAGFDHPERAFPHQPHPSRKSRFSDYAHLARALELATADDSDGEGG